MLDLFSKGNPDTALKQLSKDLKKFYNNDSLKLVSGSISDIGNCILYIQESIINPGFMKSKRDSRLTKALNDMGLNKVFFTYACLQYKSKITIQDIKETIPFITRLIDIIEPKLIVIDSEKSSKLFFNKKVEFEKDHSTILGHFQEIPVIFIYPFDSVYNKNIKVSQEQQEILKIVLNDIKFVSNKYKEFIKNA